MGQSQVDFKPSTAILFDIHSRPLEQHTVRTQMPLPSYLVIMDASKIYSSRLLSLRVFDRNLHCEIHRKIVSDERLVVGGVQNIFNGEFGWKYNVFVRSKNLSRNNAMLESQDYTLFLLVRVVALTTKCSFLKS